MNEMDSNASELNRERTMRMNAEADANELNRLRRMGAEGDGISVLEGRVAELMAKNTRLRAEVVRLREAIRPFAGAAELFTDGDGWLTIDKAYSEEECLFIAADLRSAATALAEQPGEEGAKHSG